MCGIFQTDAGLEVRAGYRDDLLASQVCPDLATARTVAAAFKRTLLDELGSLEDIPL